MDEDGCGDDDASCGEECDDGAADDHGDDAAHPAAAGGAER